MEARGAFAVCKRDIYVNTLAIWGGDVSWISETLVSWLKRGSLMGSTAVQLSGCRMTLLRLLLLEGAHGFCMAGTMYLVL